jgi:DNA-binding MarR family transcriptional regulator
MSEEMQNNAAKARQILELLPPLRNWVTSRVQATGAHRGISLRQLAALRGIEDGATSPGELARLWQVTPAVITGIVDRLERRGLVRREVDPQDRRRLRLALTESGRAASEEIQTALVEDLAAQLALATRKELAELGRSLALLQRTFAALEAKAPALVAPSDDENPLWIDADDGLDDSADREEHFGRERALVGARG